MRSHIAPLLAAAALSTAAPSVASAPAASPVTAARAHAASSCAHKANRLKHRLPAWREYPHQYVRYGQEMCFDFTGDGRRDIVFTMWAYMNHGAHYWAAFRKTRHDWKRVAYKTDCCGKRHRGGGTGIGISRSGRTTIVNEPVYRRRDAACCPSGGERSGEWAWRSGRLRLVATHRKR